MLEGKGEQIILDYRHKRVFSSYEKFEYFQTPWIIVAEVDEDEILTEHYRDHASYFNQAFLEVVKKRSATPSNPPRVISSKQSKRRKRIDINEFNKATPGTTLYTVGVASCAVLTVTYKNQFGYLAHVTPTDALYIDNPVARYLLKGQMTDFTEAILKKSTYFDIYPSEQKHLQVLVAATHEKAFAKTIEKALEKGLELSNITLKYNPAANSLNFFLDIAEGHQVVEWREKGSSIFEEVVPEDNLGEIMKEIIEL